MILFRPIRAWWHRLVLGMLEHDIRTTSDDIDDAVFEGKPLLADELRRYLHDLRGEVDLRDARLTALAPPVHNLLDSNQMADYVMLALAAAAVVCLYVWS